jgi:hypothetical protein
MSSLVNITAILVLVPWEQDPAPWDEAIEVVTAESPQAATGSRRYTSSGWIDSVYLGSDESRWGSAAEHGLVPHCDARRRDGASYAPQRRAATEASAALG